MNLFASSKKWEKGSEQSVLIKRSLDAHIATYQAARFDYNAGRPEVIRLTTELNAVRDVEGNSFPGYKELEKALRVATLERDKPLQDYGVVKHELELELEKLVHFFIAEQLEEWQNETEKIKSELIHEEISKVAEEPGTFSIGRAHRIRTNRAAVSSLRVASLENQNHLRDMVHNSLPEIEAFILKAEAEMKNISLDPVIIEMDAVAFQQSLLDSSPSGGKIETGYASPYDNKVIVPKAGGQSEEDRLLSDFDLKQAAFKPRP